MLCKAAGRSGAGASDGLLIFYFFGGMPAAAQKRRLQGYALVACRQSVDFLGDDGGHVPCWR